jgi:hypothetical protein
VEGGAQAHWERTNPPSLSTNFSTLCAPQFSTPPCFTCSLYPPSPYVTLEADTFSLSQRTHNTSHNHLSLQICSVWFDHNCCISPNRTKKSTPEYIQRSTIQESATSSHTISTLRVFSCSYMVVVFILSQ